MHLFIFGYSYTARYLVPLISDNYKITATKRQIADDTNVKIVKYDKNLILPKDITHILVSIPPVEGLDLVLADFFTQIKRLTKLKWIGYLSSTGIYGDYQGDWVNEDSLLKSNSDISRSRISAEKLWLDLGKNMKINTQIFRLAGIYGPGRSSLDRIKNNQGQIITKIGQYFSRIHVEDIAQTIKIAMNIDNTGIFNLADDRPSHPEEPMIYAYKLLQLPIPSLVNYLDANLSAMALSFYLDNKRVSNKKIKSIIGMDLKYPSFVEGLDSIFKLYFDRHAIIS